MQQAMTPPAYDAIDGTRARISSAQSEWAARPIELRIAILRKLRHNLALDAQSLAETVPLELPGALHRSLADTLVAEVLPLLEACRFLERDAARILRTRHLGTRGRPLWLSGVHSQVQRAPWGIVLVIAAANYPLLLAGVQTLQALVAGNAVLWKPAPGTESVAHELHARLVTCGLEPELLTILDSTVQAATTAIAEGVDHVVLTGSAETGKTVLRQLAETITPATLELSGCDAVFVLPSADLARLFDAIQFGLRFNGSFTCMAPRRLFLVGYDEAQASNIEGQLTTRLRELTPVPIPATTASLLREIVQDARTQGAEILLDGIAADHDSPGISRPTLIARATPDLLAMQTSIFAPVLSIMRAANLEEARAANAACPFALTASIFGPERAAQAFASALRAGNVLINEIVISTADPRIPFGGRGQSGFGVTRGEQGLLAMTTPRTIQFQRSRSRRPYEAAGEDRIPLFSGLAKALHGGRLRDRLAGLMQLLRAARK